MNCLMKLATAVCALFLITDAPAAQTQVQISHLPAGSTPGGSEMIPAVQGGTTVKLTASQIAGLANGTISNTNVATALGYVPAHSGANSDITSITGLTTPLPVASGGTGATSLPAIRAALGVAQVRTLESFAVALGVSLGTSNDQAVFDAANTAIVAAKSSGGLAVALPPGVEYATSLELDNNGGYVCPEVGRCLVRDAFSGSYSTASCLVNINPADPYATNIILHGIIFDGGWSYGAGSYSGSPETDPALDKRCGVNLTNAVNGSTDTNYVANSWIASQEPRNFITDLVIARFPGDGMQVVGAGSNVFHNIRFQRIGGYCLNINGYDNNYSDLDPGECGRAGVYCHDNCAASRFTDVKIWYANYRPPATGSAGLDLEGSSGVQFYGLEVQDDGAGCIKADNTDLIEIHGACQEQGQINQLGTQMCAVRSLGAIDSTFDLAVSLLDHAGQTYYTYNHLICDGRSQRNSGQTSYTHHSHFFIVTEGFTQDFNGYSPTWFSGPLDTSNCLIVNGVIRQCPTAADPATGQANYGLPTCGTLAGLISYGPLSPYPGSINLIAPCGGTGSLTEETTTGAYASGNLTSTQNYANGETVQVGANVYTFKTTLTGAPYEVHIGATEAASLTNLTNAINAPDPAVAAGSVSGTLLTVSQTLRGLLHVGDVVTCSDPANCASFVTTKISSLGTGTGQQGTYNLANSEPTITFTNAINVVTGVIGTDYGWGTSPSFQVTATNNGSHVLTVTALSLGIPSPAIPTSETAAHASWGAANLTGGAVDNQTYTQDATWGGGHINFSAFPGHFGVQPTYTGTCSSGSQKGSTDIGSFQTTIACNGTSTSTVILTFPTWNNDGYDCTVKDTINPANLWTVGPVTGNTVTFNGAASSGDLITWSCSRIP